VAATGREAGATLTLQKTADVQRIARAIADVLHLPPAPAVE
jgi:hypothetical protein